VSEAIVSAKDLSKWYGEVIGLNNFDVTIGRGITGVVGPNGAGKSTLFKLLIGTIKPNAGELLVLGRCPWKDSKLLSSIGFCPDYDFLYPDLTGRDYLRFAAGLHGIGGAARESRVDEVLGTVEMTKAADRKIGGYSKGMKQRIKIGGALMHDPPLLLLDEPFTGTDPAVRRELIDLVKMLNREQGRDIIISTHVLHEVERLTHNIALIYKGRAVATGDISEIRGLMSRYPHNIVVEGKGMVELAKMLVERDYTVSVELGPDRKGLSVKVNRPEDFFDSVPELLKNPAWELESMHSTDDDLESVFRYMVGW
jgi:ABC-2 type transport system ATP-binding protein